MPEASPTLPADRYFEPAHCDRGRRSVFTTEQDRRMVEVVQRNLESGSCPVGVLSPRHEPDLRHEPGLRQFQDLVRASV